MSTNKTDELKAFGPSVAQAVYAVLLFAVLSVAAAILYFFIQPENHFGGVRFHSFLPFLSAMSAICSVYYSFPLLRGGRRIYIDEFVDLVGIFRKRIYKDEIEKLMLFKHKGSIYKVKAILRSGKTHSLNVDINNIQEKQIINLLKNMGANISQSSSKVEASAF